MSDTLLLILFFTIITGGLLLLMLGLLLGWARRTPRDAPLKARLLGAHVADAHKPRFPWVPE